MRNIILFIILYTFSSNLSVASIDFELSDIIKQARQAQIAQNNKMNNIKEVKNTVSGKKQNNFEQTDSKTYYSKDYTMSDNKKEQ